MVFPVASQRSVSFPRGTMVTYVTWDVFYSFSTPHGDLGRKEGSLELGFFGQKDYFMIHNLQ